MNEDHIVYDAYHAGAVDYIIKTNFEEIPDAIRAAYSNDSPIRPCVAKSIRKEFCRLKQIEEKYEVEQMRSRLTPTELQTLELIAQGLTQKEISETNFVSINTVKIHVCNILKKMGEKSGKEAAKKAKEMGVI
jgi:DNA-binding NarL/FixJ family response regulator